MHKSILKYDKILNFLNCMGKIEVKSVNICINLLLRRQNDGNS